MTSVLPYSASGMPATSIPAAIRTQSLIQALRARFIPQDDAVDVEFRDVSNVHSVGFEMDSVMGNTMLPPLYKAPPRSGGTGTAVEGAAALAAMIRSAASAITRPLQERGARWHAGRAESSYKGYVEAIRGMESVMRQTAAGKLAPERGAESLVRASAVVDRHVHQAIRHGQQAGDHDWVRDFATAAKTQTEAVSANVSRLMPEPAGGTVREMARKVGETVGNLFRSLASGLRNRR